MASCRCVIALWVKHGDRGRRMRFKAKTTTDISNRISTASLGEVLQRHRVTWSTQDGCRHAVSVMSPGLPRINPRLAETALQFSGSRVCFMQLLRKTSAQRSVQDLQALVGTILNPTKLYNFFSTNWNKSNNKGFPPIVNHWAQSHKYTQTLSNWKRKGLWGCAIKTRWEMQQETLFLFWKLNTNHSTDNRHELALRLYEKQTRLSFSGRVERRRHCMDPKYLTSDLTDCKSKEYYRGMTLWEK